jgi:putative hydrolase of the HAD superfamily
VTFKAIIFDLDDTLLDTSGSLLKLVNSDDYMQAVRRPLPYLPCAKENLIYLSRNYPLYLVTIGNVAVQRAKIESLQIAHFFREIFIANREVGETKKTYYQTVVNKTGAPPPQILSVGNRRTVDVRLSKQVGLKTCLLSYGEHSDEVPEVREDYPDYTIDHHKDLLSTCLL